MKYAFLLLGSAALLIGAACTTSVTQVGGSGSGGSGSGASGSGANGTGASGGGNVSGCTEHADCLVVPKSCCGNCGAATRDDAIAVSVDGANAYRDKVCEGDACPACYSPSDPTLLAICKTGKCELLDLHKDDATACSNDMDCRLRSKDCCECGGGTDIESLIAININAEADYAALVCDGDIGCPECAPVYPAEARAVCSPDGYCDVAWN